MNCPVDGTTLAMADREGIEIDYCPSCRGVWLDRGELDKIIERAADGDEPGPRDRDDEHGRRERYEREGEGHGGYRGKKRRRGSMLGEMFDFG